MGITHHDGGSYLTIKLGRQQQSRGVLEYPLAEESTLGYL